MRSNQGYSLFELLVVVGLISVLGAAAAPVIMTSSARSTVWTASELIGAQIRQTRLKAISRNRTFQIRFNCPAAGQLRALVMTGVPATDNHVDRCSQTQVDPSGAIFDTGVFTMPKGVTYADSDLVLQVTGRGIYTSTGGAGIPETISVSNGTSTRTLVVSLTGQITFSAY